MHPAEIQAALKVRGYKQRDVAVVCGVEPNTVSAVIHGRSRSQHVEAKIAEIVAVDPVVLWPQWYDNTEAELLAVFRSLGRDQRLKAVAAVRSLAKGATDKGGATLHVSGNDNRVAGRDYVEEARPKRKR